MKKIGLGKTKSIVLTLVMTLGLGGLMTSCNGNGEESSSIEPTGELTFDDDGNVVYDDIEIKLETVVAGGGDQAAFIELIAQFNVEHDGEIYVNCVNTPEENYARSVMQKISNNLNAPDLLMSHQKLNKAFLQQKMIQSFDNIIEESHYDFDIDDYYNKFAELSKIGTDDQYQIPIDAQGEILLYNKELLDQLGEDVPTNREELLAVCDKAITQFTSISGFKPIILSTNSDFFNKYVWVTALMQNGVDIYKSNDFKADWTSTSNLTGIRNATQAIDEMFDDGYATYNVEATAGNTQFQQGKALFCFNVPFSTSNIIKGYAASNGLTEAQAREKIGGMSVSKMFAMDGTSEASNLIYGDSHGFLMSKTCTDITKQAACLKFAKWFTETDSVGAKWAEAGHVTASNIISSSDDYKSNEIVTNYIDKYYPDMTKFTTFGDNPYFSDYTNVMNKMCANLLKTRGVYKDDTAFNAEISARQTEINGLVGFDY